jgi:hypothetical protein
MADGSLLLTILYEKPMGFTPDEMYCQFGTRIIHGRGFSGRELTCQIPKIRSGKYSLRISFDSFNWSEENLSVTFEKGMNVAEIQQSIPFLVVLTIILFLSFGIHFGNSLFFTLPQDQAVLVENHAFRS